MVSSTRLAVDSHTVIHLFAITLATHFSISISFSVYFFLFRFFRTFFVRFHYVCMSAIFIFKLCLRIYYKYERKNRHLNISFVFGLLVLFELSIHSFNTFFFSSLLTVVRFVSQESPWDMIIGDCVCFCLCECLCAGARPPATLPSFSSPQLSFSFSFCFQFQRKERIAIFSFNLMWCVCIL